MEQIFQKIKKNIDENAITLFMKGTKDMPMCGFSAKVVAIINKFGLEFKDINVLESQDLREGIKKFSDWPTIPQLYIKGEFIGGCDIVYDMYESGELKELFEKHNLIKV